MIKKLSEFNSINSILKEKSWLFESQVSSNVRAMLKTIYSSYDGEGLTIYDRPYEDLSLTYLKSCYQDLWDMSDADLFSLFKVYTSKKYPWIEVSLKETANGGSMHFEAKSIFMIDKWNSAWDRVKSDITSQVEKAIQSRIYLGHSYLDVRTSSGYGIDYLCDQLDQCEDFSYVVINSGEDLPKIRISWNIPRYPENEEE